jgi:hypothetical protein
MSRIWYQIVFVTIYKKCFLLFFRRVYLIFCATIEFLGKKLGLCIIRPQFLTFLKKFTYHLVPNTNFEKELKTHFLYLLLNTAHSNICCLKLSMKKRIIDYVSFRHFGFETYQKHKINELKTYSYPEN